MPLALRPHRQPGTWAGRWVLAEDWDSAAVNEEIAESFEVSSGGNTEAHP